MRPLIVLLAAIVVAAVARPGGAQVVEIPTFDVAEPSLEDRIGPVDVAVGTDGNMLFLWYEWSFHASSAYRGLTRLLSPLGMPLTAPTRVDLDMRLRDVQLA